MRLNKINIVEGVNVNIYGSLNYRCFSIKCSADEFKKIKDTGLLIAEVSIYDKVAFIECDVNAERTADLIAKALKNGIKVTYYGLEERGDKDEFERL